MTGASEGARRRFGYLAPHVPARADLAAAGAVACLLAQLLLAQLTLVLTICFLAIGRSARWRPMWLAWPAALGVAWVLSAGLRHALAGYLAGGSQVIRQLSWPGSMPARLDRLPASFGGWRRWLPAQAPAALIAAAVQAACVIRLGRPPRRDRYRPGLIVAARRTYLAAAIRRGETATADGGCLGVVRGTGGPAAISWREAESGVLCTGQDAASVAATGYQLASAAIQRRMAVIVVDLSGAGAGAGRRTAVNLNAAITQACASAGAPMRRFGHDARYQPLPAADPGRGTGLVIAMTDWRGTTHAQQLFCADYVSAAMAAIAAAPGRVPEPRTAVLDQLAGLLTPGSLAARLRLLPADRPVLARAAELAGQLDGNPALISPVAAELGRLRSAELGRWLRPACCPEYEPSPTAGPGRTARAGSWPPDAWSATIALDLAITDRQVVLFPLDRRQHGRAAVAIARLVAADLTAVLAERAVIGAAADCLIWISGCELLDPRQLATLVAVGVDSGAAVLLGTAAEPAAVRLASDVNVLVLRGPAPPSLAAMLGSPGGTLGAPFPAGQHGPIGLDTIGELGRRLPGAVALTMNDSTAVPAEELLCQRPDELSLLVKSPQPRTLLRCAAVR